jgi:hypothetical protein
MSNQPTIAPRPEAFGITSDTLAVVGRSFVERHRSEIATMLPLLALGFTVAWLWRHSGSLVGAFFVSLPLITASLVLLVPFSLIVVAAAERLECRWRSTHNPTFAACVRFRTAERQYRDSQGHRTARLAEQTRRWLWMARPDLTQEATRRLAIGGWLVEALDRRTDGADLIARRSGTTVVVRVEPGPVSPSPAVMRELIAARHLRTADHALLVAPAGPGAATCSPLSESVLVWDAEKLATPAATGCL